MTAMEISKLSPRARLSFLASLGALTLSPQLAFADDRPNGLYSKPSQPAYSRSFKIDPERRAIVRSLYFHDMDERVFRLTHEALDAGYLPTTIPDVSRFIAGEPNSLLLHQKGLLIFFDDSWKSHFDWARRLRDDVRKRYGLDLQVNLATITKLEDPKEPVQRLPGSTLLYPNTYNRFYGTLDDVVTALKEGHRVDSHTPNHGSLGEMVPDKYRSEISTGISRVLDLHSLAGLKQEGISVVYPAGSHSLGVRTFMGSLEGELRERFRNPNFVLLGFGTELQVKPGELEVVSYDNRHNLPRKKGS